MTDKITTSNMTMYEYTRLLIARSLQLRVGAPPKITWIGPYDPILIAKEEIKQRVVPLSIERRIPDNTKPLGYRVEMWDPVDMDISDF